MSAKNTTTTKSTSTKATTTRRPRIKAVEETVVRTWQITRENVEAAIARCDEVGVEAFLAETGFRMSRKWFVKVGSRMYPSKAILGWASGLRVGEFNGGGADDTGRTLGALGFQVVDVTA